MECVFTCHSEVLCQSKSSIRQDLVLCPVYPVRRYIIARKSTTVWQWQGRPWGLQVCIKVQPTPLCHSQSLWAESVFGYAYCTNHDSPCQHSLIYPPSFLSRYLERLVRSLVYLPVVFCKNLFRRPPTTSIHNIGILLASADDAAVLKTQVANGPK